MKIPITLDRIKWKHNPSFPSKFVQGRSLKQFVCLYYCSHSITFQECLTKHPAKERNEPYILMQAKGDDNPFSLMIGEQKYCSLGKSDNTLGHAVILLMAFYYVFTLNSFRYSGMCFFSYNSLFCVIMNSKSMLV